jgi:hypothetical protein
VRQLNENYRILMKTAIL